MFFEAIALFVLLEDSSVFAFFWHHKSFCWNTKFIYFRSSFEVHMAEAQA